MDKRAIDKKKTMRVMRVVLIWLSFCIYNNQNKIRVVYTPTFTLPFLQHTHNMVRNVFTEQVKFAQFIRTARFFMFLCIYEKKIKMSATLGDKSQDRQETILFAQTHLQ